MSALMFTQAHARRESHNHTSRALILSYVPHAFSKKHCALRDTKTSSPLKFPPEQNCCHYQVVSSNQVIQISGSLYSPRDVSHTGCHTGHNSIKQKYFLMTMWKLWSHSLLSSVRPSMFHWLKTLFWKRSWDFQFLVQPVKILEIATYSNNRKKLNKLKN